MVWIWRPNSLPVCLRQTTSAREPTHFWRNDNPFSKACRTDIPVCPLSQLKRWTGRNACPTNQALACCSETLHLYSDVLAPTNKLGARAYCSQEFTKVILTVRDFVLRLLPVGGTISLVVGWSRARSMRLNVWAPRRAGLKSTRCPALLRFLCWL